MRGALTASAAAQPGGRLASLMPLSSTAADSKTLDSHQQLLRHDMRVLENLMLDDVPAGDYELIALPLKLIDADADWVDDGAMRLSSSM